MLTVRPVTGRRELRDFLSLPAALNRPGTFEPARHTERALLTGRHPLSQYLTLRGLVAYSAGEPVGRIGLSTYDGDRTGYVGFLQAASAEVASALFATLAESAVASEVTSLVGPVDGSFWLRYRLKVAGFDERPYFGEPLNPPTHVGYWNAAGFAETDRYRSAFYAPTPTDFADPRFEARLRLFRERGFEFRSPRRDEWDSTLADLHGLLHELYREFPVFKAIDLQTFRQVYAGLRTVVDLDVVTLAYRDGRAEGFCVAVPDYGVGLSSGWLPSRLWTLARGRVAAQRYVLLYLGVRQPGLGRALTSVFARQMSSKGAEVVGALTHVGKASEAYARDHLRTRTEYTLLRRDL